MAVITVSREPGALGEEFAARVAGQLGFLLLDKANLTRLWNEMDLDEEKLARVDEEIPCTEDSADPESEACVKLLPDLIAQLAEEHDLVIIGRGAQGLFHNRPGTLHVRAIAPRPFRIQQMQIHESISAKDAKRRIKEIEAQRTNYLHFLYNLKWKDPSLYDLTLRMDRLTMEQAEKIVLLAVDAMKLLAVSRAEIVKEIIPEAPEHKRQGRFVNAAEREFAGFLEFYGIPYEYEPRTFTLETDAEGKVIEAFTPDFYLPEQDLYIELTTMKQSLVTRKNRKLRKLRRLYPEINIRIFYQRDFNSLLAKYGLLGESKDRSS